MSEEKIEAGDTCNVNLEFWNDCRWELIAHHKIDQESFIKIRAKNPKVFATFLGPQEQLSFFMFKPLSWECYKEIRTNELDKYATHEYILKSCLLWPLLNDKNMPDAGTILTLVYQILAQSSFLKNPEQALSMIVSV